MEIEEKTRRQDVQKRANNQRRPPPVIEDLFSLFQLPRRVQGLLHARLLNESRHLGTGEEREKPMERETERRDRQKPYISLCHHPIPNAVGRLHGISTRSACCPLLDDPGKRQREIHGYKSKKYTGEIVIFLLFLICFLKGRSFGYRLHGQ